MDASKLGSDCALWKDRNPIADASPTRRPAERQSGWQADLVLLRPNPREIVWVMEDGALVN